MVAPWRPYTLAKIPNTEVLQICGVTGIEAFLMSAQFRWVGHVTRMDDTRLPKIAFYCELEHGTQSLGGQRKLFKDMFKSNMKACSPTNWSLSLQTDHRGGPCLRSKYPSSRTTACNHCRTNALNVNPVINHHLTAASRATSAVVYARQELVSSHIDVFTSLRDPEIRRA